MYFLISQANITTILAKTPPKIENTKLLDIYGLLRHSNPSSELTDTTYVSIKLKIDNDTSHLITLTDSFIEVNFDRLITIFL